MGVELRPLRAADVEAWAELLAACEKVDRAGEHLDSEDLAEELADPNRDPERDFVGAWMGDRLVGAGTLLVRDHADVVHRIHGEGWTHPDHRGQGIGTSLISWAIARSREAHAARFPDVPGELEDGCLAGDEQQCALLTDNGFTPVRWFFTMEADLAELPDVLEPPVGLQLLPYAAVESQLVRAAHNSAFADHWGFVPWSPEMWQQWVDDTRAFRPDHSRVLVSGDGAIAAYVVMYEYEAQAAATGRRSAYVGKIGVLREWRGRGVASALLSIVLHDCRTAGYPYAALDVDADNPTGALGVYERLGFTTTTRWVAHTLPV